MQSISELIWEDQSTMERVVKIVNGLWNGTVKLINHPKEECPVCQIGESWFHFMGKEDNVKLEEIREKYDVFTLAQMILESIIGLDDDEYTYYCDNLGF